MNITFLILAHSEPRFLANNVKKLLNTGHYVCLHYDKSAPKADLEYLEEELSPYTDRFLLLSEYHCEWGEWSLVEAPLFALDQIKDQGWNLDYVHLMSGLEALIKPINVLENFLQENPYNFIESVDISSRTWVKGGLEIERLLYEFPYNFIRDREKFDTYFENRKSQKPRAIPKSIRPHMGSQWWTLRWDTCIRILQFHVNNPDVVELYRTSWIPDEGYFQTIVRAVSSDNEVVSTQLLYHHLIEGQGRPLIFMNGHEPLIRSLPHFFLRKISPHADELLNNIDQTVAGKLAYTNPTLKSLKETKAETDQHFLNLATLYVETCWSNYQIESKSLNSCQIIILVHDQGVNTQTLHQQFADLPNIKYLGRPFKKGKDSISHNIFENLQKQLNLDQAKLSAENFIDRIPFLFPELQYVVFSYIPHYDWIDRQHSHYSSQTTSLILESPKALDLARLKKTLTYEKLEMLKTAPQVSIQNLLSELSNVSPT